MDLDTLAAELYAAFIADCRRRDDLPVRGDWPFEKLPEASKDSYRAVARRALELLGTARTITVTGL
jgi:hypothetical protein